MSDFGEFHANHSSHTEYVRGIQTLAKLFATLVVMKSAGVSILVRLLVAGGGGDDVAAKWFC